MALTAVEVTTFGCWSAASARVPGHPCVAERDPRGEVIVRPAEAAKILARRWPAPRLRLEVVEARPAAWTRTRLLITFGRAAPRGSPARLSRIAIHHRVPELPACGELVMRSTRQPDVLDRRGPAQRAGADVIDSRRRPQSQRSPESKRHSHARQRGATLRASRGRGSFPTRTGSAPSGAREAEAARQDEVEAAPEGLGRAAAGAGVPERVLRRVELLEEAGGHGQVQLRELGVEPLQPFPAPVSAGWSGARDLK
jgi:hypothetical protein